MLQNTFIHISGVSENIEEHIKSQGIESWDDFIEKQHEISNLSEKKKRAIIHELVLSKQHLENSNLNFFSEKLPNKHLWRCINIGSIAYVDIETTGLSKYTNKITTIGIYDGTTSKIFIRNKDLDDAWNYLSQFDIVVTFNGKQFDIPFIEYHFNKQLNAIHFDLRFMLKEFNLSGGLKSIEQQLGLSRNDEIQDMTGHDAVKLWRKYEKLNCEKSLQKLILYNIEDIENLEKLLSYYMKKKKGSLYPFS